jgi:hypothetical protein
MLGLGDILDGEIKHCHDDEHQADDHRNETSLIIVNFTHLPPIVAGLGTFEKG